MKGHTLQFIAKKVTFLLIILFTTLGSSNALAGPVSSVPKAEELELEINYFSRGVLKVTVTNTSEGSVVFNGRGLYFVPVGQRHIQRMGVAGSFAYKRRTNTKYTYSQEVLVEAGESVDIRLSVYCLDRTKSYPSSRSPLRMASKRLPDHVTQKFGGSRKNMQNRVWNAVNGQGVFSSGWHAVAPYKWKKKKKGKALPTFHPNP